jgi:hypothetical protein
MEARIKVITSQLTVITDAAQIASAMTGDLLLDGKPILVTRGNDFECSVRIVYSLFAKNTYMSGRRFVLSKRLRGLCHSGAFDRLARLTNHDFEWYLSRWAVFAEEVPGPGGTPVLKLVESMPRLVVPLLNSARFLKPDLQTWFEWKE